MAIRPMVYEPDPVLRTEAKPVTDFGEDFQVLVDDMFETMYANQGCGLAAPQIGISLTLSVIDVSADKSGQFVIVNPEIIETRGTHEMTAGCLSVPGSYGKVKRAAWVKVRALDRHGKPFEVEGEGVLSECLQHEIDHLRGKLFIDHLQPLKKKMLQTKSRKFRKKNKLD
ncbi:peptide deformylase [Sansalvadorimonas sp. 2012CJ34-2]|uniref:Peptide deformylase n=1 Tax=Parendozoicomonas callyspongiae TaxID=2942213 RepID=A0ABT0PGN3_9GAMM|nr:peptide deformylase [Sansalvadorimonas sp. 2012CJ34-2]MCL6269917.1 peptide deformylase [Sansalvadorimonas sp. 2012CJ34-2]